MPGAAVGGEGLSFIKMREQKPQTILVIVGLVAIPIAGFMVYSAALAPLPDGFPPPTMAHQET
jgi:hypothetical protein